MEEVFNAKQSRWFIYTMYEGDDAWDLENFHHANEVIKYHCRGYELCPKTGRPHLQGCINTWKKIGPKTLGAHLGWKSTYLRCSRANDSREIVAYCQKCGEWEEDGVFVAESGFRTDLASAVKACQEGGIKKVSEEFPTVFVKHPNGFRSLESQMQRSLKRDFKTEVWYIWGPPDYGKSQWVEDMCETLHNSYFRLMGEKGTAACDWDKYDPERDTAVWIDDIDVGHEYSRKFLCQLFDKYAMDVRGTGGWKPFLARQIYVTSNFSPEEVFDGDEAILRRIDYVVHANVYREPDMWNTEPRSEKKKELLEKEEKNKARKDRLKKALKKG